jgi:hypothetical protein
MALPYTTILSTPSKGMWEISHVLWVFCIAQTHTYTWSTSICISRISEYVHAQSHEYLRHMNEGTQSSRGGGGGGWGGLGFCISTSLNCMNCVIDCWNVQSKRSDQVNTYVEERHGHGRVFHFARSPPMHGRQLQPGLLLVCWEIPSCNFCW